MWPILVPEAAGCECCCALGFYLIVWRSPGLLEAGYHRCRMWTKLLPEAGGCNFMFLPEAAGRGKKKLPETRIKYGGNIKHAPMRCPQIHGDCNVRHVLRGLPPAQPLKLTQRWYILGHRFGSLLGPFPLVLPRKLGYHNLSRVLKSPGSPIEAITAEFKIVFVGTFSTVANCLPSDPSCPGVPTHVSKPRHI